MSNQVCVTGDGDGGSRHCLPLELLVHADLVDGLGRVFTSCCFASAASRAETRHLGFVIIDEVRLIEKLRRRHFLLLGRSILLGGSGGAKAVAQGGR
jgi:hypothetical protein